jgi:hypothetical protein
MDGRTDFVTRHVICTREIESLTRWTAEKSSIHAHGDERNIMDLVVVVFGSSPLLPALVVVKEDGTSNPSSCIAY